MTRILVLIDGSVYSQSVCAHAAWSAKLVNLPIDLVHILDNRQALLPHMNLSGSIGLGARTALLQELTQIDEQRARLSQLQGRAILDDAKAWILENGITAVGTKLRHDDLLQSLHDLEQSAAVIVIGKRGEGADFATLHLGSNLERIIRATHRPVLVAARTFRPIKHMLIAHDCGPSAQKAVAFLSQTTALNDVECSLLFVGTPTQAHRDMLEQDLAKLRNSGFNANCDCVTGEAETVITERVETDHIDLLVMGAYGHSRIRNLIIGSTTTEMIRSCKIPLMLFH